MPRPITRPRSSGCRSGTHRLSACVWKWVGTCSAEDYARALEGRELLRREVDSALAGHAALVLPTLPIPAPPIGAASVQVGSVTEPVRNLMLRLTQLFNLTGHPAIALPAGRHPGWVAVLGSACRRRHGRPAAGRARLRASDHRRGGAAFRRFWLLNVGRSRGRRDVRRRHRLDVRRWTVNRIGGPREVGHWLFNHGTSGCNNSADRRARPYTPMSSFHRSGCARMKLAMSAMQVASWRTSTVTPRDRSRASSPTNV